MVKDFPPPPLNDDEANQLLNDFTAEMNRKGFMVMRCPECNGALWLEGEKEVMLMRYSTIFDGECMSCIQLKKELCQ